MYFTRCLVITALFLVPQMICLVTAQQCGAEYSIYGKMLKGHTFQKTKTNNGLQCLFACNSDVRCQSFNYVMSQNMCELNNRTKEARPKDFVSDVERYYYRKVDKRAKLGSIPELSAESCKEIKLSEGGEAVSGKYWFYSILPGKITWAYCDMKTEDVDECSVSPSVCDVNAICKNIRGSFTCTCKAGFTGDGRHCTDVDECSDSPSVCDVNAVCKNIHGSFTCTCKAGFTEDGKRCKDINECQASPCDARALCTNTEGSHICHCKAGWTGNGLSCQDVDECSVSPSVCGVNATCKNIFGSFTCTCKAGFTGDGQLCTDINECQRSPCDARASCINTEGSYICQCNAGLTGTGFSCQALGLIAKWTNLIGTWTDIGHFWNGSIFVPYSVWHYGPARIWRYPVNSDNYVITSRILTGGSIGCGHTFKYKQGSVANYSLVTMAWGFYVSGSGLSISQTGKEYDPQINYPITSNMFHNLTSIVNGESVKIYVNGNIAHEITMQGSGADSMDDNYVGLWCHNNYRTRGDSFQVKGGLECSNYKILSSADRKITTKVTSVLCDGSLTSAWYRFLGAAGTRMPTSCPPTNRCATHATGWLSGGAHPTVAEGQVDRKVCFHWSSYCCRWFRNIKVKNCGTHYVYYLTSTPTCSLRYCGTD